MSVRVKQKHNGEFSLTHTSAYIGPACSLTRWTLDTGFAGFDVGEGHLSIETFGADGLLD